MTNMANVQDMHYHMIRLSMNYDVTVKLWQEVFSWEGEPHCVSQWNKYEISNWKQNATSVHMMTIKFSVQTIYGMFRRKRLRPKYENDVALQTIKMQYNFKATKLPLKNRLLWQRWQLHNCTPNENISCKSMAEENSMYTFIPAGLFCIEIKLKAIRYHKAGTWTRLSDVSHKTSGQQTSQYRILLQNCYKPLRPKYIYT